MKKQLLLASAVIALLATSCSKNESEKTETQQDGYIRVNSSIVGESTKATTAPDAALTGIQFRRVDDASTAAEATANFGTTAGIITGTRATGAASGITFAPVQKYDKSTDNTAYFFGYHGTTAGTDGTGETTWVIDGKTDVLLTNIWNAGRYSAPKSTGMKFNHILAQVEVILQAPGDIALDAIRATWGKVTKVEVETAPTLKIGWADAAVSVDGAAAYISMLAGTSYADDFAAIDIPANGNTTVTCGAMIGVPTTATQIVKVKVTTKVGAEADVVKDITVTLAGNLEAGKTHKITLTFGATDKEISVTSSEIVDWSIGSSGSGSITQ